MTSAEKSIACLASVRPELAQIARHLANDCRAMGINIIYTWGLRTNVEQAILYAQGRSTPGRIVTQAPDASRTPHGRGAALDFAILDPTRPGTLTWAQGLFYKVGQHATQLGLEWGGNWPKHPDPPHIQIQGWQQLSYPWP